MIRATRTLSVFLLFAASACGTSSSDGGGIPTVPVATSITLTPASTAAFVSIGETRTITALARDASQSALANPTISFASSNAAVATVSGTGTTATVTAVADGPVTITATSGSAAATVSFTVAQSLATIALLPATPSLAIGATVALQPSARDARGNAIGAATGFTFTTASAGTAIVSSTGAVTAIAPGSTTITASLTRDGTSASGTATITVTAPTGAALTAAVGTGAFTFLTPSVTITVGGSVTWTFGAATHNVIFSTVAGAPTNVSNIANATVTRTFPTTGTFPYQCTLHTGMVGTVIVQAPGFLALLNGSSERPTPNNSTGSGAASLIVSGTTVNYTVAYQGITGPPTGLHIHSPGGVNAAVGVSVDLLTTPLTATSGVLTGSFTATNIRTAGVSLDSLITLLRNGNAYVNVHSTTFPGGEIRGQVTVP